MKQQGLFAGAAFLSCCILAVFWFWRVNPSDHSEFNLPVSAWQIGCTSAPQVTNAHNSFESAAALAAQKEKISLVLNRKIIIACPIDLTDQILDFLRQNRTELVHASLPGQTPFGVVNFKIIEKKLSEYHGRKLIHVLKNFKEILKNTAIKNKLRIIFNKPDVFYGGENITPDVLHRLETFVQGIPLKKRNSSSSSPPDLAVVNLKKLIPLNSEFYQVEELNREIVSWKIGNYGIAEPLLSARQLSSWKNDCKKAYHLLNEQMGKTDSAIPPSLLSSMQLFFNKTYENEIQKQRSKLLNNDKIENENYRTSLQSYARKLAFKAQKRFILYQEKVEEENLKSKNPLTKKEIGQKLSAYQNNLASHIQSSLKKISANLNRRAKEKLGKEVLQAQQSAFQQAKHLTLQRYGSLSAAYFSLNQKQAAIESWLKRKAETILAAAPKYQTCLKEIKSGNNQIPIEIIKKMKSERKVVLKKIKMEIFRQAAILAKKEGVTTIVSDEALNLNEMDLTPRLMEILQYERRGG